MSGVKVICHDCSVNGRARLWRWLCAECAEECRDRHRRETGHTAQMTADPADWDELTGQIGRVARLIGKRARL